MPAMSDDAIFLTYRVDCIAGKPPPTVFVLLPDSAVSDAKRHFTTLCSLRISAACQASIVMRFTHESQRGKQPTLGDIGVVLHR